MVDYQKASSITELITRAAERQPDRTAIWAMDESCSYRELLEQADQIAAVLIQKGVQPGDRVAILSSRSLLPYVAIMAALRAGCVYMPLNLRFPLQRNLAILRRGKPAAVIVDEDGLRQLQNADFGEL